MLAQVGCGAPIGGVYGTPGGIGQAWGGDRGEHRGLVLSLLGTLVAKGMSPRVAGRSGGFCLIHA